MFRLLMFGLCKFLVLLGLLACMPGRAAAVDPCEVIHEMHTHDHEHDHPADWDGGSEPCDSSHDKNCPTEHHHHHHGCVCAVSLMTDAKDYSLFLGLPSSSLLRFRHDPEIAPEGPFLSEDKPPLI